MVNRSRLQQPASPVCNLFGNFYGVMVLISLTLSSWRMGSGITGGRKGYLLRHLSEL